MGFHVEILLANEQVPRELPAALARLGAWATFRPIERAGGSSNGADACIVVLSGNAMGDGHCCPDALETTPDDPVPTLILSCESDELTAVGGDETIGTAVGISAETLAEQIATLCAAPRPPRGREGNAAGRRFDPIENQLHLAGQLQRDLLPDLRSARFDRLSVRGLYRPIGPVSGDSFEILPMADGRIAVGVFDAAGHGPAAAMLSMYLKRALREIVSDLASDANAPAEVFGALNGELVAADLTDCHFLAGSFVAISPTTGRVCWSHGGAPYPILLRQGQPPVSLRCAGGLIGAIPEQTFVTEELTLNPGDALLLGTDGLEALLSYEGGNRLPEDWHNSAWYQSLRSDRIAGHFDALEDLLNFTSPEAWPADDVTILAIECRE